MILFGLLATTAFFAEVDGIQTADLSELSLPPNRD